MDRSEFYRRALGDTLGPLEGVRVLDFTSVWAGPLASSILGDLGCDVVRVEMPRSRAGQVPPRLPGTELSWFHETVNRHKRSLGLDLRKPGAAEVFLRLAATADVLIENYRPGTLDRWGVGFEACRAVSPGLVFVSISGFGQYGEQASLGGYDPIIQAASGWMSLNGAADGPPAKAPTFLADDVAALHAVIAALAALRHRDATGEGQHVDLAMLDALLFQSDGYLTLAAAGVPPQRLGDETGFAVPSNRYHCADGWVYLIAALDRQWRRLAGIIGRPELATDPAYATNDARIAHRDEVNALVAAWCAEREADEVVRTLTEAGLTASRLRTFTEVAADPRVREREMLQEATLSDGSTAPLTGPPAKFSRTPTRVRSGAPRPGAHTVEILTELGFDAGARATLEADGAI